MSAVAALLGLAAIIAGVALIYVPAALIVGGFVVTSTAIAWERSE